MLTGCLFKFVTYLVWLPLVDELRNYSSDEMPSYYDSLAGGGVSGMASRAKR
jgi:hypothetical protein